MLYIKSSGGTKTGKMLELKKIKIYQQTRNGCIPMVNSSVTLT